MVKGSTLRNQATVAAAGRVNNLEPEDCPHESWWRWPQGKWRELELYEKWRLSAFATSLVELTDEDLRGLAAILTPHS
jgi:hypothetical protein